MALTYSWGGTHNNTSNTSEGGYVRTPDIAFLTARADLNGSRPIYLYDVFAEYATGAAGINPVIFKNGVESGGGFRFATGGTFEFRIRYSSGTLYFGRVNGWAHTYDSDGSEFTGYASGGMPGHLTYAQVTTAPTGLTVTATGRNVAVNFSSPTDNGGDPVDTYTIQYSKDGGAWAGTVSNVSGSYTYTNLDPGTYAFRVYANNAAGSSAAASRTGVVVHSGGKVRVGGAWLPGVMKVRVGGAWVNPIVKVRAGGAWKDAQ